MVKRSTGGEGSESMVINGEWVQKLLNALSKESEELGGVRFIHEIEGPLPCIKLEAI